MPISSPLSHRLRIRVVLAALPAVCLLAAAALSLGVPPLAYAEGSGVLPAVSSRGGSTSWLAQAPGLTPNDGSLALYVGSAPNRCIDSARGRAACNWVSRVSHFVGWAPHWCVESADGLDLCTWAVSTGHRAWRDLAVVADTDVDVNLLCELPRHGAERTHDSCTVHPRESDRRLERMRPVMRSEAGAKAVLRGARTLVDISRIVGAGPTACSPLEAGTQRCRWDATRELQGFDLLGTSIGRAGRPVVLECTLPSDGGRRASDSCVVRTVQG